jgi:hypothetical protein
VGRDKPCPYKVDAKSLLFGSIRAATIRSAAWPSHKSAKVDAKSLLFGALDKGCDCSFGGVAVPQIGKG